MLKQGIPFSCIAIAAATLLAISTGGRADEPTADTDQCVGWRGGVRREFRDEGIQTLSKAELRRKLTPPNFA